MVAIQSFGRIDILQPRSIDDDGAMTRIRYPLTEVLYHSSEPYPVKQVDCFERTLVFVLFSCSKMEELQHKKGLPISFNAPLRKVDTVLDSETRPTKMQIATQTSSIEQLTEQGRLLCKLDAQIATTIETENEFEAEIIIDAESTQEAILDKMSQINGGLSHTSPTTRPLNVSATEFVPSELVPRRERPVSCLPKLNLPSFVGNPLTWQGF